MLTPAGMAEIARANAGDGPPALSAEGFAALLCKDTTLAVGGHDGFVVLIVAGQQADVHSVEVAPRAQGRGLGGRLFAQALAAARERGVAEMFLEVATDNDRARRLYDSAGFAVVGQRRGYYRRSDGTRCDALVMMRRLDHGPDAATCPQNGQTGAV